MNLTIILMPALLFGLPIIAHADTKSPGGTIISTKSIGSVRLGMTAQEASMAGGTSLKKDDSMGGDKYRFFATADTYFWIGAKDGRIHMACARSNRISTENGIRMGDSAKKLSQFSRDRLKHMKNPMYYQLQPTDIRDRGYVIWFEVQGDKIEGICTGTSALHSYVMEGGT